MAPKSMSSKYEFILCEYFDYFEISKGINIKYFQEFDGKQAYKNNATLFSG